MLMTVMLVSQLCLSVVMGMYFFLQMKSQHSNQSFIEKESKRELERLHKLNKIKLTEPLTERSRPRSVKEIVGQEDGIRALRSALCGKNPQHILIYGPPGVGKTAASRVVLDEAKKNPESPFKDFSKFVEVDATTMQFDERSFADPLIGSVHDPIYQGAGAYGPAGVPQPKEGAVTRAHGGVLFIDEIGELPSQQLNKLLKVLEDRRVYFDSAYYSRDNKDIPPHIHEMFKNGLPADFRLIGATTRMPEELPPALRSRCVEIFFRSLSVPEIKKIAADAARKTDSEFGDEIFDFVAAFADNGRDAVNIVQSAESVSRLEKHPRVELQDVEWVVETGKYSPRYEKKLSAEKHIGRVSGLAVFGRDMGCTLDIEAVAHKCGEGCGKTTVTGAIDEEEISNNRQKLKRKSSISASVRNMETVMKQLGIPVEDYEIHINFPNSMPVDGPSAGIAIFCAVYSAIKEIPIEGTTVLTGELSVCGEVYGVGEVPLKVRAAIDAGAKKIIIPAANRQQSFDKLDAEIIAVDSIQQVMKAVMPPKKEKTAGFLPKKSENIGIISAEGVEIFKKK
ncbi:MAG: ATP-dependent protease LonB [Ruminococcaceae bacterium]|nr:ATP-dependent protease LonB [Oscillospiraceae bacterium]